MPDEKRDMKRERPDADTPVVTAGAGWFLIILAGLFGVALILGALR